MSGKSINIEKENVTFESTEHDGRWFLKGICNFKFNIF